MIITKLHTLSQFIEHLNTEHSLDNGRYMIDSIKWCTVRKYNDSLKQEITEEMFYNKLTKPQGYHLYKNSTSWALNAREVVDCQEYEAAEKKVIFEGWEWFDNTKNNNSIISLVKKDDYTIHFHNTGEAVLYIESYDDHFYVNFIEQLANATSGQLPINIEI